MTVTITALIPADKRQDKLLAAWSFLGAPQRADLMRHARKLLWLQDHPVLCAECGQPRVLLQHHAPKIRTPFICEECKHG